MTITSCYYAMPSYWWHIQDHCHHIIAMHSSRRRKHNGNEGEHGKEGRDWNEGRDGNESRDEVEVWSRWRWSGGVVRVER